MPKPSKQIIIDAIIKEIEQGVDRGKVVVKYCKKFQKSTRTIDTYWKTANQQHTVKQAAIKEQLAALDTQAALDARKMAIMTAQERQEKLTKLILGEEVIKKPMVVAGKVVMVPVPPDYNDLKGLVAELNKMDGSYAPTKTANTDKDGNDVVPPQTPLNDGQVDKILSALRKNIQSTVQTGKK